MVTWNIGCGVGLTRGLVTFSGADTEDDTEADTEDDTEDDTEAETGAGVTNVRPPGPPRVTRFTSGKLFVFS